MVTLNDLNKPSQPQAPQSSGLANPKAPLAGLGNLLKPIGDIPLPLVGNVGNVAKNILPLAGAVAGGIGGAAAGAPSGPGAFFTGVAGAGAGGELGEWDEEGIEKLLGFRKDVSKSDVQNAATGSMIGQATGETLNFVLPKALALFTGKAEETVKGILDNPENYTTGFKQGRKGLNSLVEEVSGKIGKWSQGLSDYYDQQIAPIANNVINDGGKALGGLMDNIKALMDKNGITSAMDYVGKSAGRLMPKLSLDFEKSPLITQAEQTAVKKAYGFISDLNENSTVKEINDVIQKVGKIRYNGSIGETTGGKIIGKMYDAMSTFINENVPELAKVKAEIQPAETLLKNVEKIIPQGIKGNAELIDKSSNEILNLIKGKGTEELQALEQGGKEVGKDIVNYAKGVDLSGVKPAGTSQYVRSPISVAYRALGAIPNELLKIPVAIEGMGETGIQGIMKGLLKLGMSEATMKTIIQDITQNSMKQ